MRETLWYADMWDGESVPSWRKFWPKNSTSLILVPVVIHFRHIFRIPHFFYYFINFIWILIFLNCYIHQWRNWIFIFWGAKGGTLARPDLRRGGGGGGGRPRGRHRNEFFPHHIYCAQLKVKWGEGAIHGVNRAHDPQVPPIVTPLIST